MTHASSLQRPCGFSVQPSVASNSSASTSGPSSSSKTSLVVVSLPIDSTVATLPGAAVIGGRSPSGVTTATFRQRRYGAAVNEPNGARSETRVVAFLAFIGILMAFGIDAALPAYDEVRADFDLDARNLSPAIIGTVYFVGMAVGQLFFGVLADRFGRRPILLLGISVYALGALGSAVATDLEVLLLARLVWGLGAAAPTVIRFAIARDLFQGDAMARVVTVVTAVFLLGPILAPVAGEGILLVGSWRMVFVASLGLAAVALVWTIRFGETLAAEHRRDLRLRPLAQTFVAVARTRVTLWAIIAQTFFTAAFLVWLGSAQPILDTVYGRDRQFTLFFGLSGAGMALALMSNKRLIERFGTAPMALRAALAFVVVGVLGLAAALAADGVPSVWVWFGWAVVANSLTTIMTPMSAALALEPMADKAGTASAILGLAQLGAGALLAAVVDAQIDATVTPMIAGSLTFACCGTLSLFVATRPAAGAAPAGA
ncbi:MAG: MFS transporter [Ilumatobacter sp.]|nr:MFS transporter [Ilumatobacter sp.]